METCSVRTEIVVSSKPRSQHLAGPGRRGEHVRLYSYDIVYLSVGEERARGIHIAYLKAHAVMRGSAALGIRESRMRPLHPYIHSDDYAIRQSIGLGHFHQ